MRNGIGSFVVCVVAMCAVVTYLFGYLAYSLDDDSVLKQQIKELPENWSFF